jgi:ketosteroid isomerase-like protein
MIPAVPRRLTLVVVTTVGLAALAPWGRAASNSNQPKETTAMNRDLAGLQQAERTWVRALEGGDPALLETIVDDPCSFIGPDGEFEDRAAYLGGYRALPSLGVKVEKIDVDQVQMRVLGDTGVVTGHVLARVKTPEKTIVEDVRFTRVYRRHPQGWRMIAGQGTRLAPAPK